MMNMSVPNQRIVKVHREMPGKEGNFLQIKKSNLYDAYKNLNATALCLYLYLVGNMNGYNLEFSPKAIHEEMGMPESLSVPCGKQGWLQLGVFPKSNPCGNGNAGIHLPGSVQSACGEGLLGSQTRRKQHLRFLRNSKEERMNGWRFCKAVGVRLPRLPFCRSRQSS